MGLKANIDELASTVDEDGLSSKLVRGYLSSMGRLSIAPGFRSRVRALNSEQLSYVASGEVSVFMNEHEHQLSAGDFLMIPPMTAYWLHNKGEAACVIVDSQTPPRTEAAPFGLFADSEPAPANALSRTFDLSEAYRANEAVLPVAGEDAPFVGRRDAVRSSPVNQSGHMHAVARRENSGKLDTLYVHGEAANFLVASRGPGYHSKPHVHESEQLNFVLEGVVQIFIDGACYALKTGDFLRVPGWSMHWAFNHGDGPCVLAEVHAPVLAAPVAHPVPLCGKDRLPFIRSTKSVYFEPPAPEVEAEMQRNAR